MSDPHRIVIPSPYVSWFDRKVFCWRSADRDVLRDFETLVPQINRMIESCLFEAVSLSFVLMVCLLGKTDNIQEAQPYIIFAFPDIQRAKQSRDRIISSGVLKTVSTPFRLGIMPSIPYGPAVAVSPPSPDLSISLAQHSLSRRSGYGWIQENLQSGNLEILYKPTKGPPKIGLEIFIQTRKRGLRRATGNIVVHEGKPGYLCLTAAHAFRTEHPNEELMNWGTDYCFTLDEPSTTSRFGNLEIVRNTSLGLSSIESPISAATYAVRAYMLYGLIPSLNPRANKWPEWRKFTDLPQNIPEEELPRFEELQTLGHLKHLSPDCDWAMVAVTNENLIRALATRKDETSIIPVRNSDKSETFATVYTYDGTVSGVLLPGSIFQKMSGGKTFKRVLLFQVTLDDRDTSDDYKERLPMSGLIRMGDCGSPVADSSTGKCYGHIISVSEDGKTAFVMSASDSFEAMKSEANMGPIIWSGLEPSSRRREHSIVGDLPIPAEPNIIATAEAWMTRHNAILANMKESHKISSDNSEGTNSLRIAIVNFQERALFEERYIKWVEMLSKLLREMVPYAIIGHSPYFFRTYIRDSDSYEFRKSLKKTDIGLEEYSRRLETMERQMIIGQQTLLKDGSDTETEVEEFEPDIIVMVRASKRYKSEIAKPATEYAEKKGILLLAAPSSEDPSPTSEVLEMIRVYSADGDGHSRSRYTGVEGHEHGIMTLGECVRSVDRPKIKRYGPDTTIGRLMSGDSCAAVVAAGITAMILQQARSFLTKDEWYHLRRTGTMYALLRSMGELDEESKLYWIKHWEWFGPERTSLDFEKEVRLLLQKNPPVQRPPAKE